MGLRDRLSHGLIIGSILTRFAASLTVFVVVVNGYWKHARLRQWSHDIHNNPRRRIDKLKEQLSDLAMGEQSEQTRKEAEELRAELEKVYSDDDIFWRQRSKVTWAGEGDRNTSFFHAAESARKSNNSIRGLLNSVGRRRRRLKLL